MREEGGDDYERKGVREGGRNGKDVEREVCVWNGGMAVEVGRERRRVMTFKHHGLEGSCTRLLYVCVCVRGVHMDLLVLACFSPFLFFSAV